MEGVDLLQCINGKIKTSLKKCRGLQKIIKDFKKLLGTTKIMKDYKNYWGLQFRTDTNVNKHSSSKQEPSPLSTEKPVED